MRKKGAGEAEILEKQKREKNTVVLEDERTS